MMADSQATTVTVIDEGDRTPEPRSIDDPQIVNEHKKGLTLDQYPETYVLPTHLSEDEVYELEEQLLGCAALITHDITRARLILAAVSTPRRARFELQARKLSTHPIETTSSLSKTQKTHDGVVPAKKRTRISTTNIPLTTTRASSPSEAASDSDNDFGGPEKPLSQLSITKDQSRSSSPANSLHSEPDTETQDAPQDGNFDTTVKVIRTDWLRESMAAGKPLPITTYLIYEGQVVNLSIQRECILPQSQAKLPRLGSAITNASTTSQRSLGGRRAREGRKDRNAAAAAKDLAGRTFMPSAPQKRQLLHETTSEHDEVTVLPEMPDWVKKNKIYACERVAPLHPPNETFIELLKQIRLARTLTGDEIGVRAYSTSIASIASYLREFNNVKEIMALPGCDQKIANLFHEYQDTGHLQAAEDVVKDPVLSVLNDFYNIWGVGATTAREFYYDRGWRDHDDIIEYGWNQLNRHQQIGLKYFDEFEQKLSRSEVEFIASVVTYHAKQVVDDDIQCVIVGGYRRGKKQSGDVDLILSHPREECTKFLVTPLIRALEESGWITHTLILSETNSNRNQEPLPMKSSETRHTGFDTLDKALIVWQDPNWRTREEDLAANPNAKNPNVHRRVDIIISPWKTVGCAVGGWTSGTTFQRDLRRYSRRVKGWKYDSSGVRELGTGRWVDLEKWSNEETRAKTWQEAERRVFEGYGLDWIEPEDRNSG